MGLFIAGVGLAVGVWGFIGCQNKAASPSVTPGPTTGPMATLTIRVTDLKTHKGNLIFGVFDQADGFPKEAKKSVNWQVKPADGDSITFTCRLPVGVYGASVLHDENGNGEMDLGLFGIPKEGYGVTNNPKPKMRAATFKESLFSLGQQGANLTISLQYF